LITNEIDVHRPLPVAEVSRRTSARVRQARSNIGVLLDVMQTIDHMRIYMKVIIWLTYPMPAENESPIDVQALTQLKSPGSATSRRRTCDPIAGL
jgi:hypothetical protein